jgi:hypothetical protein
MDLLRRAQLNMVRLLEDPRDIRPLNHLRRHRQHRICRPRDLYHFAQDLYNIPILHQMFSRRHLLWLKDIAQAPVYPLIQGIGIP